MPLPRREVDELARLHALEGKKLQEVFVEGGDDKRFYEAFLADHDLAHIAVLEIATVNVPDGAVLSIGLEVGNKGRVVTLAALLEGRVHENEVVCIADADMDRFIGVAYSYALLLLTDYTSIELYALCPSVMQRILAVALGGFPKTHAQVTNEVAKLLEHGFILRVAAKDLAFAPAYPHYSSFCAFDKRNSSVSFRLLDYTNKAFESYRDKSWREPLSTRVEERRKQLKEDSRLQIHGHDFAATFAWYIRQHPGFGHLNAATVEAMLLGFVDSATLAHQPMFRELLRRLRSA